MNKYKKLLGNSFIFAIGNLGSKLIAIMLVPFYTYLLTTKDYGTVDLITTTVNMLLPIISLSTFDTVLRFVLDKHEDNQTIISNAVFITIIGSIVFLSIIPILGLFNIKNTGYLYIILVAQAFQSMLSEYARAIERIKLFAFNGVFGAVLTGTANFVLMFIFKMGISGYLLSLFISAIGSTVLLSVQLHLKNQIHFSLIQKDTLKRMLVYSIPLIPNALAWWVTNASSRYFILFFVNVGANGLFAVANKIPSLLTMLNAIFFQSWQISAIEEFDSSDKSKFYSKVFSYYAQFLFLCSLAILLILKPFMHIAVSGNFYSSWQLVPLLLLSVIYSSFSGFLGTNYVAAKKTIGVMTTTLIGAVLNIIFCFIFVPIFKANGAGLASSLSFFFIWIIRIVDTKKFISIRLNISNLILNHIVFILGICILFFDNLLLSELGELILLILLITVNRKFVFGIINIFIKRFAGNK